MAVASIDGRGVRVRNLTIVGATVRQCVSVLWDMLTMTSTPFYRKPKSSPRSPTIIRKESKGGQATAAAIFLARSGRTKEEIREYIQSNFDYDLSRHVDEIRPTYRFTESSQGTVPPAIRAFIDSTDFEDAIRTAVSLGGDSDTLACITGGIAQAFYGLVPEKIQKKVYLILDDRLRGITRRFMKQYCEKKYPNL